MMEDREKSLDAFSRLVVALEPYLEDVVFIGGWAHRLFALLHRSDAFRFQPLTTDDADIGLPLDLKARARNLDDLLLSQGCEEVLSSLEGQSLCKYRLSPGKDGLLVEFLTPLHGSSHDRDGSPKLVSTIAGATAQRLLYLEILLLHPWQVVLSEKDGFCFAGKNYQVMIPNPASWLMQKLLVLPHRAREKKAKDVLYLHDTVLMFSDKPDIVFDSWLTIQAEVPRGHPQLLRDRTEELFPEKGPPGDLLHEAALIAKSLGQASPPSPAEMSARCRHGLRRFYRL